MSPSLQTMGFFMSDINFCNTKEQLNHLGEVVTGKVDGSPTGVDIDTSTLPYTGQVRKTLPALEAEYEQSITDKEAEADTAIDEYRQTNKGAYAAGITLENKFEFITYSGESYFATNPPYTTTATTPDNDTGNLFVGGYTTLKTVTDTIGNPNLLSNHNFLKPSPDDITHPSVTPTDYVAGTQIFSGVFVSSDVVGLTYINGRVKWTNATGSIYLSVANTNGLEYVNEFTASVADFDGMPRTRGVSFSLVGNEYRVAIGIDSLEDESANETLLGSVKLEKGSLATNHQVQTYKGIDYSFITTSEMVNTSPPVGSRVKTLSRKNIFDRGGAEYVIVSSESYTGTPDGLSDIELDSGDVAVIIIENVMSPEQFGAVAQGQDNIPVFESMMNKQVEFSFAEVKVKQLFEIRLCDIYEIHSTLFLRPFISIRTAVSHVQTLIDLGYGFNAIGDFTGSAIIDAAPYNIDGERKPLIYASAGDLFDFGNYKTCGNVTLENFLVKSDDQYDVTDCAFEAIHLSGANGCVVKNIYGQNTIQGISVTGGWQQDIQHNKFEHYWIGGLFWSNTTGYAKQNYFARDANQRTATWSQVASRPFYTELVSGYLAQKNIALVNIKSGVKFDSNIAEAQEYGWGIITRPNDWTPTFKNTYMEKINASAYLIDSETSFDIGLGMMTDVTNLLDVKLGASDGNNNKITFTTLKGTEFHQGAIDNIGSFDPVGSGSYISLNGFWMGTRGNVNGVYFDRGDNTSIKFQGNGGSVGLENVISYNIDTEVGEFSNGSFKPIASRDNSQNPDTSRAAAGISVNTSTLNGSDFRGSWQMVNNYQQAVSLRILRTTGWSDWENLITDVNGTTSERPTMSPNQRGQYFDNDLGIPIWWNGTAWVNASGTTV